MLDEHARLVVDVADLSDDDDLFRLGMTSHASVRVMLALEDDFGVEFPEHMLRKQHVRVNRVDPPVDHRIARDDLRRLKVPRQTGTGLVRP